MTSRMRRASRLLAVPTILLLVIGSWMDLLGDCDREALLSRSGGAICMHAGSAGDPSPQSSPDSRDHHSSAHCVCSCHTVVVPSGHFPPEHRVRVGTLELAPPAGLPLIDLPAPLRPPIGA